MHRHASLQCFAIVMTTLVLAPAPAAEPVRRILAIGGKTYGPTDPDRRLLQYFLALTGKKEPVVYLLPTASGDSPVPITAWYENMNELSCRPRHLRLFNNSAGLKNLEQRLLSADAIFVGGGSTLNMLAVWKAHGVDRLLRSAWERGVVLAGESAGMICWFEQGLTDARPEKLTPLTCLGFLPGSACPHFNEPQRQSSYHQLVAAGALRDGFACDDGVALLFENNSFVHAVSASPKAKAYRVRHAGAKVAQEPVAVAVLK